MNTRHRLVASFAAIAVIVTACGGDDQGATGATVEVSVTADDPTAVDDAESVATTAATTTTTAPAADATAVAEPVTEPDTEGGPDATVSPDLPAEIAAEVGAMQVIGDPLPEFAADPATASDPAIGMPAPVLVGQDFDGNTVRVDAAADGPTLVLFLAHWCPHCNNEVPRINELRDAGELPPELNIVAVSTAIDPSAPNWPPSEWLTDLDWTFSVIADGVDMEQSRFVATTAFGVGGFPFGTMIGADGTVTARWAGEHETGQLLDLITSNLA